MAETPWARFARWLARPRKCGNCRAELPEGVYGYCDGECEFEDQMNRAV